ncbi:phosphomannomutase/phosphoglucomutase [bacterium]|nr:MAG: phosphomannomutase/phosphoglucomutase [bacterium]
MKGSSIFRAYDVRGKYPEEVNEGIAEKIAYAWVEFEGGREFVCGFDVRNSSPSLAGAVMEGMKKNGGVVWDLGLITTPLLSYTCGRFGRAGIMVTASHNPPEYNGFKLIDREVLPVGYEFGLDRIEKMIKEIKIEEKKGTVERFDALPYYVDFLRKYVPFSSRKVVVDCSNGCTFPVLDPLLSPSSLDVVYINENPDGNFPAHDPNPLKVENLRELGEKVKEEGAFFGVCFDGDGDRAVFVDEHGNPVSPDLITGVIARILVKKGDRVLCDVRTSRSIAEEIERLGGIPERVRVGHAYARRKLKEVDGVLGGELAGHYYFRDLYYADSGILAFLLVLRALEKENKTLSQVIGEIKKYHSTGEINFLVEDKEGIMEKIEQRFSDGRISKLDGITIEYEDWWFNVRPSNTEPYLRLVIEAETPEKMEEMKKKIEEIINEGV